MTRNLLLGIVFGIVSVSRLSAQQDFADVEIETIQVADNLYVLFGAGGNVGLSTGDDGALLVDAQYAPLTQKILAAVAAQTDDEVRFVINTHWHGDHTGGNENLGRRGAMILAHDNVRVRMSRDVIQPLFNSTTTPAPAVARPAITYADETTMHWNDESIRIFHVPNAHTDGDSIVHFQNANVIHMGDTLWTSGFPRIDSQVGGGSVQGVIDAAETAMSLANEQTQLIPGHGDLPPRGTAFLREYVTMLRDIQIGVSDLIESGLSEEAVVAARPTAAYDAQWGQGYMSPELFTRVVFASLMRSP
jgi:glyoxylase-like metal-dependent hydrolase (beta-lactamase superfamily II)